MKRRELLVGSAAAVGAPSAIASAATAATVKHDAIAMEATLARIDKRMSFFNQLDLMPRAPETREEEELFASRARLGRAALRSLYFTGTFMELEEHQRVHPGVQERMRRLQPEMDEACDGMAGLLEALTPADYRALQDELKKDPDAGLRIGEHLSQVAAEDGMGFSRRVDLRLAMDDVMRRLRTQNPALVLEPYARKTRRVQAQKLSAAAQEREVRVKAGEKAFWEFQERTKVHLAAWEKIYAERPRNDLGALEDVYPEQEEHPEDPAAGARIVMRVGGYLLGVGLGLEALAGIFYLASIGPMGAAGSFAVPALILGVTIGPVLIVGGLIVLIVGAAIYGSKKPPDEAPAQ